MQSQSATGPGRRQKRWQVRGSFGGRRPGGGRLAASGRKFWLLQAKPAAHIDFQLGDSPWLRPSWLGELRQLSQCSRPSSRSLGERRGPPLEAPGVPDDQGLDSDAFRCRCTQACFSSSGVWMCASLWPLPSKPVQTLHGPERRRPSLLRRLGYIRVPPGLAGVRRGQVPKFPPSPGPGCTAGGVRNLSALGSQPGARGGLGASRMLPSVGS